MERTACPATGPADAANGCARASSLSPSLHPSRSPILTAAAPIKTPKLDGMAPSVQAIFAASHASKSPAQHQSLPAAAEPPSLFAGSGPPSPMSINVQSLFLSAARAGPTPLPDVNKSDVQANSTAVATVLTPARLPEAPGESSSAIHVQPSTIAQVPPARMSAARGSSQLLTPSQAAASSLKGSGAPKPSSPLAARRLENGSPPTMVPATVGTQATSSHVGEVERAQSLPVVSLPPSHQTVAVPAHQVSSSDISLPSHPAVMQMQALVLLQQQQLQHYQAMVIQQQLLLQQQQQSYMPSGVTPMSRAPAGYDPRTYAPLIPVSPYNQAPLCVAPSTLPVPFAAIPQPAAPQPSATTLPSFVAPQSALVVDAAIITPMTAASSSAALLRRGPSPLVTSAPVVAPAASASESPPATPIASAAQQPSAADAPMAALPFKPSAGTRTASKATGAAAFLAPSQALRRRG